MVGKGRKHDSSQCISLASPSSSIGSVNKLDLGMLHLFPKICQSPGKRTIKIKDGLSSPPFPCKEHRLLLSKPICTRRPWVESLLLIANHRIKKWRGTIPLPQTSSCHLGVSALSKVSLVDGQQLHLPTICWSDRHCYYTLRARCSKYGEGEYCTELDFRARVFGWRAERMRRKAIAVCLNCKKAEASHGPTELANNRTGRALQFCS